MYSVESSTSDQLSAFKIGEMKNMFTESLDLSSLAPKPICVNEYNNMNNTDNDQTELDDQLVNDAVLQSNCVLLEAEEQPTDYNNDVSKSFENNEEEGNEEEEEEANSDNMMIDTCLGQIPSPRRFVNNTKLKIISNLSGNTNNMDEVMNVDASADWDKVYSKRLSNAHRVSLNSRQETNDAETEEDGGDGACGERKSRQVYKERRNNICSLDAEHGKEQCAIANLHTENHMVGNSWEVQVFDSYSADALHGNLADKYNNYNNNNINNNNKKNNSNYYNHKSDNANDMTVNTEDNFITGNKSATKPRTSNFTQFMVDVSTPQVSVHNVKQEYNKLIKTVQGAIKQLDSKRLTQSQLVKLHKLAVQYCA